MPATGRRTVRPRILASALACGLAAVTLLGGCSDDGEAARTPGEAITTDDAQILADVLHKNLEEGGATVSVTAPFAEGALLSMTGAVDFASETGTLDSVTTYPSAGQPDETRVLYFTRDRMVIGGIPGLADAMAAAGRDGVQYLRVDLAPGSRLVDTIATLVLNLRAETADDPDNLIAAGTTWQGAVPVDGVAVDTFRTGLSTVSVGVEDDLLYQYVTTLANNDFAVTVNLTAHGEQTVDLPPEEQIADASAYPEVAVQFGY